MLPFLTSFLFYIAVNYLFRLAASALGQKPLYDPPTLRSFFLALAMGNDYFINNAGVFGFLWFLPAYFIASCFFFIFSNIKASAIRLICLFLLSPICTILLINYVPSHLIPWGIGIALLVMPLMTLGTAQAKIINCLFNRKKTTKLLCFLLPVFIWFVSTYTEVIRLCILDLPSGIVSFYFLVFCGWLWVTSIAVILDNSLTGKVFAMLGQYSFQIYILHIFFIDIFRLLRFFYCDHFSTFFIGQILMLLFSLFGPIVISKCFIKKVHYPAYEERH